MGKAYDITEQYDESLNFYQQAINLNPKDGWSDYYQRGWSLYMKKEFSKAIFECTQAIVKKGDYFEAFNLIGESYRRQKDYEKALTNVNESLRLSPNYSKAFETLAAVYQDKGEPDKAIEIANKAISIDKGSWFAVAFRGLAYKSKGKEYYDNAIADLTKAIEINNKMAWVYRSRADTYELRKGALDSALAEKDRETASRLEER